MIIFYFLCEECLNIFGEDIKVWINKLKFKDYIKVIYDKLRINRKFFEIFFQFVCDEIIKYVKKLFIQFFKFIDVNKIFMVGGFFELYIL